MTIPCDLFTVEVLTLAGLQRYLVFFVTALPSRRVTIAGIHPQPYGTWMEQRARNLRRWCAETSVRRGPGHRDGRRGMIST